MALTISTGFVVDDAIVVTENIARLIEEGKTPFEAALEGSRQIGFTIISITAVADRGVHPDPAHGGDHRAAVPRVRGHAERRDRAVGDRVADGDADDGRATCLRPRERAAKPAGSPAPPSGASPALVRGYDRALGWVLAPRAPHAVADRRARWGSPCCSRSSSRRGCSRSRTPGLISGFSEASQDISSTAMRRAQEKVNAIVKRRSRRRPRDLLRRRRAGRRQHRDDVRRAPPLRRAQEHRRPDHRPPPPEAGARPGHHAVPAVGPGPAHGRRASRARSTSTRSRTPTSAELSPWAPRVLGQARRASPSCATSPPTSRPPACRLVGRHRSRHRRAPRDHAAGGRRHALRRLRPAPGGDLVHARSTTTASCWRRRPRSRRAPISSRTSTCAARTGGLVPLPSIARFRIDADAAGGHAPGAVPGDDALVQSGAERRAR